jgi:putative hydrolase of the HAD superfamily
MKIKKEWRKKMYKNYIFDLYGTLVDIRTDEGKNSLWKKMSEFYRLYGAHYTAKELQDAFYEAIREQEKKVYANMKKKGLDDKGHVEIKIDKVFLKMFTAKGVKANKSLAVHAGQMFRVLSMEFEKLYDGVIEFLEALKKQDKKVYLLSNAQYIFTYYELQALGLLPYFDGVVISSEEGCKKPSKNFYNVVLDRYNLNPSESIMIGNDQYADIQGAKNVGLDALYIHQEISPEYIEEQCPADYKVLDGDFTKVGKLLKVL